MMGPPTDQAFRSAHAEAPLDLRPRDDRLSVVVPAYNAEREIEACLDALTQRSRTVPGQVIVVDDGSSDATARRAARFGVEVVCGGGNQGPGPARNLGTAQAAGEIILFIDADVAVAANALERLVARFDADPACTAVFGSYDDTPGDTGLVSTYRNLLHHWVHQGAGEQASHFWAGLGAIKRTALQAVGGFDEDAFSRGLEDVELGYRLHDAGYRIAVEHSAHGTHLKRWTIASMVRTDVFVRAIPWTRLILERRKLPNDFSLGWQQRLSVVWAWLVPSGVILAPVAPAALLATPVAACAFLMTNRDFARFLTRRKGWRFTLAAMPVHWIHHFSAGLGLLLGLISFWYSKLRRLRLRSTSP